MLSKIDILTLFPEVISPYIQSSIIKRAVTNNYIQVNTHNLRDYSSDLKHHKVDDVPFGGSMGMVIKVEPVKRALDAITNADSHVVLLSPVGKTINMDLLHRLGEKKELVLLSGHYEGFDKRIDNYIHEKISIGNIVLTGGEIPAMLLVDALVRLIPGVLGNTDSCLNDSFYNGLLDWDVFTRPQNFDIFNVPDVLFSGHHRKVELWKKRSALVNTLKYKPDLLASYKLNKEEQQLLVEYLLEEERNE